MSVEGEWRRKSRGGVFTCCRGEVLLARALLQKMQSAHQRPSIEPGEASTPSRKGGKLTCELSSFSSYA
jgi:hypothetical protein